MAGIGMNFAAIQQRDADLEATLVDASQLGMDDDDLRVLSVLTTWLGVHHVVVDVGRLVQLVGRERSVNSVSIASVPPACSSAPGLRNGIDAM